MLSSTTVGFPVSSSVEHRYQFPSRIENMPEVRQQFLYFLSEKGVDTSLVQGWELVFTEAVTNAVEHGNLMDRTKLVTVNWWQEGKMIFLSVADQGTGPRAKSMETPQLPKDFFSDSGRGFFIIQQFADSLDHAKTPHGYQQIIGKVY